MNAQLISALGNIIILIITWLLLHAKGRKLNVIFGSDFLYSFLQFMAGFICSAFLAGLLSMLLSAVSSFSWHPAPELSIPFILKGFYHSLSSVLFEELVFRGVLLYMAINWLGEKQANLLSAFTFGMYCWFTYHALSSPIVMLWILVFMGLWGMMLAYAYSRTGSLALPLGLHLGWNFIDQFIFNRQGDGLFTVLTTVHTRYLTTLEEMLFLRLPTIAFAVVTIILLRQYFPVKVIASR